MPDRVASPLATTRRGVSIADFWTVDDAVTAKPFAAARVEATAVRARQLTTVEPNIDAPDLERQSRFARLGGLEFTVSAAREEASAGASACSVDGSAADWERLQVRSAITRLPQLNVDDAVATHFVGGAVRPTTVPRQRVPVVTDFAGLQRAVSARRGNAKASATNTRVEPHRRTARPVAAVVACTDSVFWHAKRVRFCANQPRGTHEVTAARLRGWLDASRCGKSKEHDPTHGTHRGDALTRGREYREYVSLHF